MRFRCLISSTLLFLCPTLSGPGTAAARDVYVDLRSTPISVVPAGSAGPWIGVGEQWGDFYDVCVGGSKMLGPDGELISPTIAQREALYDRLAKESLPIREIPNSIVRVDFLWDGLENPTYPGPEHFSYARTDFSTAFVLRQLGSQIVGLLGPPVPDWIEPFLYDAAAGVTLAEYKQTPVRSTVTGIVRTGEERLLAWEQYVAAVVGRYRDLVGIWQVLNEPDTFFLSAGSLGRSFEHAGLYPERIEPNADRFGELFDDFVFELVTRAARVIRRLDPTAKVAALGLLDANDDINVTQSRRLLERLIARGLANVVDMVSLHTFPYEWPESEGDAISLDYSAAADSVVALAQGTGLRFMMDEWGHAIESGDKEGLLPQFMIRLLAQNLAIGVSPLIFFEAYDWLLFPRDLMGVQDYYLLKTFYPWSCRTTPGFDAMQHMVRLFAGAVGEDAINEDAPHATRGENPGYSYRSFTNGLDRLVAFWSNSSEDINPVIRTVLPSGTQVHVILFRRYGMAEEKVVELPSDATEFGFKENGIGELGWFESALIYFCPGPDVAISITGPDSPVFVGMPVGLEARGPNGQELAPTWRVVQESGLGVVSPAGQFQGVRKGTCTAVASVGIHTATHELTIADLSENLLANSSFEVMESGASGLAAPPWRSFPPAEKAMKAGASVNVASGEGAFLGNGFARLIYPPTIGVDQDESLIEDWWPGYISQTLVSGLGALGKRPFDEPLLFFCWARRPQGAGFQRYIHLHVCMFDRFRNPQTTHKLADVRIGGKFGPGTNWELVSSVDQVGAPYVLDGRDSSEFAKDGRILLPADVELLDVIVEIDNRFVSPPTTAEVDAIYLGPYQPLILVESEAPGETLDLAWFFDRAVYPGAAIRLYLDVDIDPKNGNEWPIPGAQNLPARCQNPFRLAVAAIPEEIRNHQPVFAYGVAGSGAMTLASDYAGPLLLKHVDVNSVETWSEY